MLVRFRRVEQIKNPSSFGHKILDKKITNIKMKKLTESQKRMLDGLRKLHKYVNFTASDLKEVTSNGYFTMSLINLNYVQRLYPGSYKWITRLTPELCWPNVQKEMARLAKECNDKKKPTVSALTEEVSEQPKVTTPPYAVISDQQAIDHLKGSKEYVYEIYRLEKVKVC